MNSAVFPLRHSRSWLLALTVGALLMLAYVVAFDQGAVSAGQGLLLHEFMHDGRHLLGVPCH